MTQPAGAATLDRRHSSIEPEDIARAGMIKEYLGKAGFHVVHAETGAAVSPYMRARPWTPSCST
jgi:hypothetical protein